MAGSSVSSRLSGLFSGQHLRARSMRATVLVMGGFGAQKALQLGSNLILTRILFPEAFGLMALVTVFITGLTLMSDVGIHASLVRSSRSDEPVFQSTAWTLQVVRGIWITGLAWLLAWPYARLYEEPLLFPLICVGSLTATIAGFKSVQMAIAQRRLILGRMTLVQVLGQAASVVITILVAWWTGSVWALAVGNVLGAVAIMGLSHLFLPSPNHRFTWDRSVLSEIVRFGRWILLGTLFTYLGGKGIQAVRGYLTDIETLAFLHIAAMLAWMLSDLIKAILSSVVYPALSDVIRRRPQALKRITARLRTIQIVLMTPAFVGLAVVASPLIDLLYDARYAAAGPFLTLLAMNGAIGALPMVYQNAVLAMGDSRAHALVMGVSSAARIAGAIIGFHLGGPVGMLVGDGAAAVATFALTLVVAVRKGIATLPIDGAALAVLLVAYAILLRGLA